MLHTLRMRTYHQILCFLLEPTLVLNDSLLTLPGISDLSSSFDVYRSCKNRPADFTAVCVIACMQCNIFETKTVSPESQNRL
jgi:hypothetical protein